MINICVGSDTWQFARLYLKDLSSSSLIHHMSIPLREGGNEEEKEKGGALGKKEEEKEKKRG